MPLSYSNFFKNALPAPDVVLLPDALFFVRAISVADGTPPADLVAQAELALEALAPFPLAQLYYGFYHPPGIPLALLYVAYRKRFTTEQTAAWAGADLVVPSFVALLGGEENPDPQLCPRCTGRRADQGSRRNAPLCRRKPQDHRSGCRAGGRTAGRRG